jgi:hypothetical protein
LVWFSNMDSHPKDHLLSSGDPAARQTSHVSAAAVAHLVVSERYSRPFPSSGHEAPRTSHVLERRTLSSIFPTMRPLVHLMSLERRTLSSISPTMRPLVHLMSFTTGVTRAPLPRAPRPPSILHTPGLAQAGSPLAPPHTAQQNPRAPSIAKTAGEAHTVWSQPRQPPRTPAVRAPKEAST